MEYLKLYFFVTDDPEPKPEGLSFQTFQPTLIFVSKDRACPWEVIFTFSCSLLGQAPGKAYQDGDSSLFQLIVSDKDRKHLSKLNTIIFVTDEEAK